MSTIYSVGQMNQLADALEVAGYTPDDVTRLRSSKQLPEILAMVRGNAKIELVRHLIGCSADPYIPGGWTVEEHHKAGQLEWDPAKITLFLVEKQKTGTIHGHNLRKELADKSVLNACVLDYLLAHPELIPEDWKGEFVFFWGTIYRNSGGNLYVRCLFWFGGKWYWYCHWLGSDWYARDPAACSQV